MQRDTTTELGRPARLVLGEHALDLGRGELLDAAGQPAALRAQALALLCVLGERAGEVVGKDELMRRVWGDVVVTEDSLVQAVGDIRRVLGDADHRIVRTVPRRGYRLQGEPSTPAPQPSWPAAGTQAGAETATPVAPPLDPAASDRSELPVAPAPVHRPGLRWPTLAGHRCCCWHSRPRRCSRCAGRSRRPRRARSRSCRSRPTRRPQPTTGWRRRSRAT